MTTSTQSLEPLAPLYWDDLPEGTRFETSGRTITESDVVGFACLTADFNRLHVDAEYAKPRPSANASRTACWSPL